MNIARQVKQKARSILGKKRCGFFSLAMEITDDGAMQGS
jgi:hypothetical protein